MESELTREDLERMRSIYDDATPGRWVLPFADGALCVPTCEERVDWGKLGGTYLLDLAALAIVGQHLTVEESRG